MAVLALTLAITLAVEHLGLSKAPVTRLWLSQLVPALAVHVIASLVHVRLRWGVVARDDAGVEFAADFFPPNQFKTKNQPTTPKPTTQSNHNKQCSRSSRTRPCRATTALL